MGLLDNIKGAVGAVSSMSKDELAKAAKQKAVEMNAERAEKALKRKEAVQKMRSDLSIAQEIETPVKIGRMRAGRVCLYQDDNGMIYFRDDPEKLYEVASFCWDGAAYSIETQSVTNGKEIGGSKRKGRVIGAVVGGAVAGPVGLAIGAGVGTGNKKEKKRTKSVTESTSTNVELDTVAELSLFDASENRLYCLRFKGKSSELSALDSFAKTAIMRSSL